MKTDMFYGLTDREMVAAFITEMRNRGLYGCVFAVPEKGGASVFASSTPAGTLTGLTAAEQLAIFAQVAATAVGEKATALGKDEVLAPEKKEWLN